MSDDSTRWLGATELRERYRSGDLSPVDVCDDVLAAIEEHDPAVNAFVAVDADQARDQAVASARRYEQGQPLGPADGVPTSIKDLFLTRGEPTLRGSLLVDEAGPWEDDAPAVARLRESGAVFAGRTTTPEFGWKGVTDSRRHGVTTNPWSPEVTAGGSSGGSAAAVAWGMGTWSIGTDGGGSVRIPAAFTGTVALKPTRGRIPLWPSSPYGTLAHAGPMTRTVADAATLLDIIGVPDPRDGTHLPAAAPTAPGLDGGVAGLRVAYSPALGWDDQLDVDSEVASSVARAAEALADAGAEVRQVDPPLGDRSRFEGAFRRLWFTGAVAVLGAYGPGALEQVDPALAEQVRRYADCTAAEYLDAVAVRSDASRAMGLWHGDYDLLLCPTMPTSAFSAELPAPPGWPDDLWPSWCPFTWPFNMTEQPALSLPCGFTAAGLPVGLQLVGRRHQDDVVLRAGHAFERATDWHRKRPPS
ncbi:MAG: amidase [Ornithinimicrobium sp.]